MARPRKSTEKLERHSLAITDSMRREMRHAAAKLDKTDAETLRVAAEIGFKFLRLIEYDVAGSVIGQAVRSARKKEAGK